MAGFIVRGSQAIKRRSRRQQQQQQQQQQKLFLIVVVVFIVILSLQQILLLWYYNIPLEEGGPNSSVSSFSSSLAATTAEKIIDQQQQQQQYDYYYSKNNKQKKNPIRRRVLLFITTIFSDRHVDYLKCCWPQLMIQSKLLNNPNVDIMIFSNNETIISKDVIDYTKSLFENDTTNTNNKTNNNGNGNDGNGRHRRVVQFQFAPQNELEQIRNITSKQIRFQMGANLGMKMGFQHGWYIPYDWVIRINPDVLIRNSTFLSSIIFENDNDNDVDGIFAICSEKPTKRIHTDFFAFRPSSLRSNAFNEMVVQPHTTNLYNHEYTAYKEFLPILSSSNKDAAKFIPDIDPSNGFCRLRGTHASIYHGHDSCRRRNDDHDQMVCNALDGWTIT